MSPAEKRDALDEIEEALRISSDADCSWFCPPCRTWYECVKWERGGQKCPNCGGDITDEMAIHEIAEQGRRALALLPRLRAVVEAAKECVASNIRPDERQLVPLRDALASLAPGEEDHAQS